MFLDPQCWQGGLVALGGGCGLVVSTNTTKNISGHSALEGFLWLESSLEVLRSVQRGVACSSRISYSDSFPYTADQDTHARQHIEWHHVTLYQLKFHGKLEEHK